MLRKKSERVQSGPNMWKSLGIVPGNGSIDRRAFLRNSGIAAAGVGLTTLPLTMVKKAESASTDNASNGKIEIKQHLHFLLGRLRY